MNATPAKTIPMLKCAECGRELHEWTRKDGRYLPASWHMTFCLHHTHCGWLHKRCMGKHERRHAEGEVQ